MTMRRLVSTVVTDGTAPVFEQISSVHGLLASLEIDDVTGELYIGGKKTGTFTGALLLSPDADQTITGAHELNIPGLTSPGTSPNGIVNIGPAISSLSSFAQAKLLPANEFTANITSNLPDAVNSYGALQVAIDSATTFANAMNVFAAASLTADDSSGQDLAAAFFESNLKLGGHNATGGMLGTQHNAIVDGTGALAHVLNMFAGPVFQNGNAITSLSVAYYGFPLQTVSGSPIITISATYFADSARIFSGSPSITTAAQFYAKPNNGLGMLNALFYGENQGTGANDYAIYLLGGKNNLGPHATSVGSLKIPGSSSGTATIVAPAAAGTPTLTLPAFTGTFMVEVAPPASAGATGVAGQIAFDDNFIYRCIATNTWKRSALSTW